MSSYRKDDYNWRYDSDESPEDVIRASSAMENLQLDRKARNLTTSWRYVLSPFMFYSLYLEKLSFQRKLQRCKILERDGFSMRLKIKVRLFTRSLFHRCFY